MNINLRLLGCLLVEMKITYKSVANIGGLVEGNDKMKPFSPRRIFFLLFVSRLISVANS